MVGTASKKDGKLPDVFRNPLLLPPLGHLVLAGPRQQLNLGSQTPLQLGIAPSWHQWNVRGTRLVSLAVLDVCAS